jgi:peptidylprolyl isomerase
VGDNLGPGLSLYWYGDKWVVIIPPELAYGSKGMRPLIPRDATLVFMIELLAANPE